MGKNKFSPCCVCDGAGLRREGVCSDTVFGKGGIDARVSLCYGHSVELFSLGQIKFLVKHFYRLAESSEGARLNAILEDIRNKFLA